MSTTTNIGLFKHDNPATNTDEFNVDKALNQNWDKLDTAIGKDRGRITTLETDNTTNKKDITDIKAKNTDQDKYISELEAENTRLREDLNGLPKGQASGESVDLSDSAEMRCELKISGNSKQETREGYNIAKINTDNFELTNNTIKNKSTTDGGNILTHIKLKAGQTITSNLLLLSKPSKDTSFSVKMGRGDVANLSFSNFNEFNLNTKQSKIYTATEDVEFDVKIWGNANKDIFEFQYWVTIGTEEKDYEQYGASPSPDYPSEVESCGDNGSINEVICNKNLFDKDKAITKKGWFDNNGKITYEGNSTIIENYIKIPNNKNITINAKGLEHIILYNKDKEFIKRVSIRDKDQFTFKEENVYFIRFQMITSKLDLNSIQIEEGSIATEFEEHKSQTYSIPTQQPMRSVGDIRDTFIEKDGKRYERHYIYRKIFDGTETFTTYTDNNINIFCSSTDIIQSIDYSKVYSSHFVSSNSYASLVDSYGKVAIRSSGKRIYFTVNFTTLDDFKSWLTSQYNAGTPVYVDYISETPLDIECTEEQNTILNQIEKEVKTYKGTTHIYSTDEISPVIDVTYKKDIDTMITNIEQAILSQGGNI